MADKGSEVSLLGAIAQAATTATNYFLAMMALGVPRMECVVSVASNNGMSMCFGATITLEDSSTTHIPLSKGFSLLDDLENRKSFAYLQKARGHLKASKR